MVWRKPPAVSCRPWTRRAELAAPRSEAPAGHAAPAEVAGVPGGGGGVWARAGAVSVGGGANRSSPTPMDSSWHPSPPPRSREGAVRRRFRGWGSPAAGGRGGGTPSFRGGAVHRRLAGGTLVAAPLTLGVPAPATLTWPPPSTPFLRRQHLAPWCNSGLHAADKSPALQSTR